MFYPEYLYRIASNKNTGKQCILYSNMVLKHKVKFKTGIKKGLETNFCPNNRKNSTRQKTLKIFVRKFYNEITNMVNMSVFKQIEYLRKIS